MSTEAATREQSEFNMALNYLSRLNQLFYVCDEAAMNLDVFQWYHTLLALFRELSTEMSDKEIEKMQKATKKLAQPVNDFIKQSQQGYTEVDPELYDSLHNFELDIRHILKTSGLQMKMKQDPRRSLK